MMLTGTDVDNRVLDLVAAGIEGYVLKQIEPGELVRAIRAAVHGEAYLHPDVMKEVVGRIQPQSALSSTLTPRELELLEWMATPNTYKQIALQLCVSEETVRSHAGRSRSAFARCTDWISSLAVKSAIVCASSRRRRWAPVDKLNGLVATRISFGPRSCDTPLLGTQNGPATVNQQL